MAEANQNRPTNLIKNAVLSFISRPVVADGRKRALISFQNDRAYRGKQQRTSAGKAKDLRPE
jgi:hypothetical protein